MNSLRHKIRGSEKLLLLLITAAVLIVAVPAPAFAIDSPIADFIAEYMPCWFCDIISSMYDSCGTYSYNIYENTKDEVSGLLVLFLLGWLIVQLLKGIASVAPIDPIEFWAQAGKRLFAGLVGVAMLNAGAIEVYGYVLSPIIEGATEFGVALLGGDCSSGGSYSPMANNAFSAASRDSIECMLETMNAAVGKGIGLGIVLIIESILAFSLTHPYPDFGMMFSGLTLLIVYLMILIVMPIYLVDAIIRMGIVGGLMPLFITAWVFPSTKFFSGKGWGMLVHSALVLVSMCIILGLISGMVDAVLAGEAQVQSAISNNNSEDLALALNADSLSFTKLLAVAHIGYNMVKKAPAIADHYAASIGGGGVSNLDSLSAPAKAIGNHLRGQMKDKAKKGVILAKRGVIGETRDQKAARKENKEAKSRHKSLSLRRRVAGVMYRQGGSKFERGLGALMGGKKTASKDVGRNPLVKDDKGEVVKGKYEDLKQDGKTIGRKYQITDERGRVTGYINTDLNNSVTGRTTVNPETGQKMHDIKVDRNFNAISLEEYNDKGDTTALTTRNDDGTKTSIHYEGGKMTSKTELRADNTVTDKITYEDGEITSHKRPDENGNMVNA